MWRLGMGVGEHRGRGIKIRHRKRPNTSIIPHFRPKVVVEISVNSLVILRIDSGGFFGYTKAKERQMKQITKMQLVKKGD